MPYLGISSAGQEPPILNIEKESNNKSQLALSSRLFSRGSEQIEDDPTFNNAVKELPKLESDMKNTVDNKSSPPSPLQVDTESTSPVLSIEPCPVRLTPLVPPINYGTVEKNMIFRSGFPNQHNIEFMESLGIRSILALVNTAATKGYTQYVRQYGIKRVRIDIAPNKEGKVNTTLDSLCEALLFALDPTNYPLYIHCNQGRHRTGCLIACLRKIQEWPLDEILSEYDAYASPKARSGDVELIKSFDPQLVFQYAKSHDLLLYWSRLVQLPVSHLTNIYVLATALPKHSLCQLDDVSIKSEQIAPKLYFAHIPSSRQFARVSSSVDESAIIDESDEFDSSTREGSSDDIQHVGDNLSISTS